MRSKTAIWIVAALSTIITLQVRGAADTPTSTEAKPVAKLSDLFADPVIVRGKGLEVKRSQVDDAFTAYAANLAAHGQNLTDENRPMREAQLLDRLIITQLLLIRSTSVDTNRAMELSKKFIAVARRAASSEEMFRRQLNAA